MLKWSHNKELRFSVSIETIETHVGEEETLGVERVTQNTKALSKWRKVTNTIRFINVSKKCAAKKMSQKRDLTRKLSKWTIVRITFSVMNFLLRIIKNQPPNQKRNSVIGGIYIPRKKSKDVSKEKYKEPSRLKNWKKIRNTVHFINLCKRERNNSAIEPLPSSFSHLYSGTPENIGLEIPKYQQEALLEMCGEEVALYLSNKPVTMTAANNVAMRVSPSYERS